jgi:hypothetical protein
VAEQISEIDTWKLAREMFGVPPIIELEDARILLHSLNKLFEAQIRALLAERPDVVMGGEVERADDEQPPDRRDLVRDLDLLRAWFEPTAKGAKIREALDLLPKVMVVVPFENSTIVFDCGQGRKLVTPEGRALMSCLKPAIENRVSAQHFQPETVRSATVALRFDDVSACSAILLALYRSWTRHRLSDVVGLLASETSTLRPAAAGLLLTLLINRNTDVSRALPRPSDPRRLELISDAIAAPAAAYARVLSGSERTSSRTLDLYRGWPLGELRRRMGSGLHSDFDAGIYLEPSAVADATDRLIADIRRRPARLRGRVPAALEATLEAYESRRPILVGLGLAFERPANTHRLLAELREAAMDDASSRYLAARLPTSETPIARSEDA